MLTFSSALPERIVFNDEIEKRLNLTPGWIEARTGIKERRLHEGGVSDLGVLACKKLLKKLNFNPLDIDVIIMSTVTPDNPWPATSCKIAAAIQASNAWAFDLSAACSGFLYSLQIVQSLLNSNSYKNILLINGDCMSSVIDPLDKNTSIIFGDGCSASYWNTENISCVKYIKLGADGTDYDKIIVKNGGSAERFSLPVSLTMEGRSTFKLAIQRMSKGILELLEECNLKLTEIDWVIPHQANRRIIDAIIDYLNVDPKIVLTNLERVGNTTNASIPLCFEEYQSKFKKGNYILLCAFGAGTTWGTALIKYP